MSEVSVSLGQQLKLKSKMSHRKWPASPVNKLQVNEFHHPQKTRSTFFIRCVSPVLLLSRSLSRNSFYKSQLFSLLLCIPDEWGVDGSESERCKRVLESFMGSTFPSDSLRLRITSVQSQQPLFLHFSISEMFNCTKGCRLKLSHYFFWQHTFGGQFIPQSNLWLAEARKCFHHIYEAQCFGHDLFRCVR